MQESQLLKTILETGAIIRISASVIPGRRSATTASVRYIVYHPLASRCSSSRLGPQVGKASIDLPKELDYRASHERLVRRCYNDSRSVDEYRDR
jgi:hypothetical protein